MALVACTGPEGGPRPPTPTPHRALTVVATSPAGPVTGATACASRVEVCATTGADGRVTLDVPQGTYLVTVTPPDGSRLAVARTAVDATTADAEARLTLALEARLGGFVRDDAGAPVAGATVCAHPLSKADPVCAKSAGAGEFSMRLPSAAYKLDAEGPAGGRLVARWLDDETTQERATVFDLRSADRTAVEVTLARGVVLNGTIRDDRGAPLRDAQVCTSTLAEPLPWDCERTARDGRYRAIRLAGRYWLWVVPPDDAKLIAQWFDRALEGVDATPVDLRTDKTIDVKLEGGPAIRGRVTTDDGRPLINALVCADTPFPTGRICRPTAGDGSYAIATRPETYVLNVLPPAGSDALARYWPDSLTWVDAGRVLLGTTDKTVDITLRRGARLTGTVRDVRGVPVEGAGVNLADAGGAVAAAALSDETGRYEIAVPRGRYTATIFAPRYGFLASVEDLSVDATGASASLDAVLPDAPP